MTEEKTENQKTLQDEDPRGSLGLLALGYQGIVRWRKIKEHSAIREEEKTRLIRPAEKNHETDEHHGE